MNTTSKTVITAVLVSAVVTAGLFAFKDVNVTVQPVINTESPTYGATPGTDIDSPFTTQNGLRTWAYRKGLATATTTVCAIKSPAATSTLTHASFVLTTSSTTASTMRISKDTTAFATTTALWDEAVGVGAQAVLVGSTTPTTYEALVFNPNTYVVFSLTGGNGTFSPVGSCSAQFIEL